MDIVTLILKFFFFFCLLKKLIYFNWRLITYNTVVVFAIHWHESAMGVHVFLILNTPFHLPPHPIPQGHPSAPALSALSHASNLDWRSVSHTIIYMFQCYSLKSSHPRLLPQSPKDCSIHLCLICIIFESTILIGRLSKTAGTPWYGWALSKQLKA